MMGVIGCVAGVMMCSEIALVLSIIHHQSVLHSLYVLEEDEIHDQPHEQDQFQDEPDWLEEGKNCQVLLCH